MVTSEYCIKGNKVAIEIDTSIDRVDMYAQGLCVDMSSENVINHILLMYGILQEKRIDRFTVKYTWLVNTKANKRESWYITIDTWQQVLEIRSKSKCVLVCVYSSIYDAINRILLTLEKEL